MSNGEGIKLAPIVLFVYNRPKHTFETLKHLSANYLASKSELHIFADGAKNINDEKMVDVVRDIIKNAHGFLKVTIVSSEKNKGLAKSVIEGMSKIFKSFPAAIVMEDDLQSSPDFLTFTNLALEKYEIEKKIFSISGYSYPLPILNSIQESAFFSYRGSSWSWATWRDRWESVNWNIENKEEFLQNTNLQNSFNIGGNDLSFMLKKQINSEIDSWAIRFAWAAHVQNKFHLLATKSKINNIGQDNSGTHSTKTNKYFVKIQEEDIFNFPELIEVKPEITNAIQQFFNRSFLNRIKSLLSKI